MSNLKGKLIQIFKCAFRMVKDAFINYKAVNELDLKPIKISNTWYICLNQINFQGHTNSCLISMFILMKIRLAMNKSKSVYKGECKFGKCFLCGKSHSWKKCLFRNIKRFRRGILEILNNPSITLNRQCRYLPSPTT